VAKTGKPERLASGNFAKHGDLSLTEVGAIIQDAGIAKVSVAMTEAMENAMPDAPAVKTEGEDEEEPGDPPMAGGTGTD
jgi:hypothetical protein